VLTRYQLPAALGKEPGNPRDEVAALAAPEAPIADGTGDGTFPENANKYARAGIPILITHRVGLVVLSGSSPKRQA
jgi:hypothetical protein